MVRSPVVLKTVRRVTIVIIVARIRLTTIVRTVTLAQRKSKVPIWYKVWVSVVVISLMVWVSIPHMGT